MHLVEFPIIIIIRPPVVLLQVLMETCMRAVAGIGSVPTLMGTTPKAMVSALLEIILPPSPSRVR